MKKLHPILNLSRRLVMKRKYNTKKITPDELLKYREMINSDDYLNNAINNIADSFIKGLHMEGATK